MNPTTNCPSCGTELEIVSSISVVLNQVVPVPPAEPVVTETPAQDAPLPTADPVVPESTPA